MSGNESLLRMGASRSDRHTERPNQLLQETLLSQDISSPITRTNGNGYGAYLSPLRYFSSSGGVSMVLWQPTED
ncbi:hypothetical protein LINPERPRIM_LOCUS2676 [Linum perenne]